MPWTLAPELSEPFDIIERHRRFAEVLVLSITAFTPVR